MQSTKKYSQNTKFKKQIRKNILKIQSLEYFFSEIGFKVKIL